MNETLKDLTQAVLKSEAANILSRNCPDKIVINCYLVVVKN